MHLRNTEIMLRLFWRVLTNEPVVDNNMMFNGGRVAVDASGNIFSAAARPPPKDAHYRMREWNKKEWNETKEWN